MPNIQPGNEEFSPLQRRRITVPARTSRQSLGSGIGQGISSFLEVQRLVRRALAKQVPDVTDKGRPQLVSRDCPKVDQARQWPSGVDERTQGVIPAGNQHPAQSAAVLCSCQRRQKSGDQFPGMVRLINSIYDQQPRHSVAARHGRCLTKGRDKPLTGPC
jgi:hypothetical protein